MSEVSQPNEQQLMRERVRRETIKVECEAINSPASRPMSPHVLMHNFSSFIILFKKLQKSSFVIDSNRF